MRLAFRTPSGAPRSFARLVATASFASVAAFGSVAHAQEPSKADLARARSAFQEGVALASANNCAAALVKYKEVAQVKNTPQVAFNMAECEARLGRLVSALGNYRVAASQAADDKRAAGVLKEAPARVEELEARIPKLTITRGKGADTASIELDGTEIGQGQLGNAIPVDPGNHTIVAKVGGKEYLHETVKLDEKQAKTFDVKISVAAPVIEPPATDKQPDTVKPEETRSKAPGIALTVAGGVVMIVGFAMLAPRGNAVSTLNGECSLPDASGNRHCPVNASGTESSANLFTGLTAGFVSVGAVAAITGIVLLARSGPSSKPAEPKDEKKDADADKKDAFWRSIHVVPSAVGASVGGMSLAGSF